jgi:hypothetical protein
LHAAEHCRALSWQPGAGQLRPAAIQPVWHAFAPLHLFPVTYLPSFLPSTTLAPLHLPQDLVLLPNATTGLNIIISSTARFLGPGDSVYSLDIGWGTGRGGVWGVQLVRGRPGWWHTLTHACWKANLGLSSTPGWCH